IETFVTAYRGDGLTGAPAEVTVRHDDVPPETVLITETIGSTDATATFAFTGADDVTTPDDLRFAWRFAGRPFGELAAGGSVTLAHLADGAHSFDVVARDRAGNGDPTPASRTFTVSRSRITVSDPEPGATVPAGLRLVRGTVAASGQEVAVTINGIAAAVHGDTFAALVPLAPGADRLQIIAATGAGVVAAQGVPVTVVEGPDAPYLLVTSPQSGVAPLAVSFSLLGVPDSATVQIDFAGNGTIDFAGHPADQIFTYSQPGLYVPVVSVVDAQGQRATMPGIVHVFDRTGLDALLQAKWGNLRDALRRGDIAQALTLISERSRAR